MNYFICGFAGAGKSYTLENFKNSGRYPGYSFVDLDTYIFELYADHHKCLAELINFKGWDWFRKTEKSCLLKLLERKKIWVALGGGTLDQELVEQLKNLNNVQGFYLNTSFETCWERIRHDLSRPLIKEGKEKMRLLYQHREVFFNNFPQLEL